MTLDEIILMAKTFVDLLDKFIRLVIDIFSYIKNKKR